jgi:hypothetical protein
MTLPLSRQPRWNGSNIEKILNYVIPILNLLYIVFGPLLGVPVNEFYFWATGPASVAWLYEFHKRGTVFQQRKKQAR